MSETVIPGPKPTEVGIDLDPSTPESGDFGDVSFPLEPFYRDLYPEPSEDVDDPDDDPIF